MFMGQLTLSDKQQRRARILERLTSGSITIDQASSLLHISSCHIRTLKQRYHTDGMSSYIHGNRGPPPANKTDTSLVSKVQEYLGTEGIYRDFNICHLAEVLARDHDIVISRSTLDRILVTAGLRKRKRPGEAHIRKRRRRRSTEGYMIQIDGSLHPWLGEACPSFCILGGIDDATGKAPYLTGKPVEVHHLPDGSLLVYYERKRIEFKKLAEPPKKAVAVKEEAAVYKADLQPAKTSRRKQMAYLHASNV